jgi:hypothetical protein
MNHDKDLGSTPSFRIDSITGNKAPQSLETVQLPHPLQDPDYEAFIDQLRVDHDQLRQVMYPVTSANPDELELWEAEQITARQARHPYESDLVFFTRRLYEEAFSVNQFPKQRFKGSAGVTVGGLVTHCFMRGSILAVDDRLGDIAQWEELAQVNMHNALVAISQNRGEVVSGDLRQIISYISHGIDREYPEIFGFRLLQLLHKVPEMSEIVIDESLLRRYFPDDHDVPVSRTELLYAAWGQSRSLLDDSGQYKHELDEEARAALVNLVALRTNPEMQLFFKYLSPSGYLNE